VVATVVCAVPACRARRHIAEGRRWAWLTASPMPNEHAELRPAACPDVRTRMYRSALYRARGRGLEWQSGVAGGVRRARRAPQRSPWEEVRLAEAFDATSSTRRGRRVRADLIRWCGSSALQPSMRPPDEYAGLVDLVRGGREVMTAARRGARRAGRDASTPVLRRLVPGCLTALRSGCALRFVPFCRKGPVRSAGRGVAISKHVQVDEAVTVPPEWWSGSRACCCVVAAHRVAAGGFGAAVGSWVS